MSALPVLYSFRRCPYAMRARLALLVSACCCELREVALRDKPDALLRLSPKGTVPVLQAADGRVLEQSLDIMLWALQQHDPQGWLRPPREPMLALIAACDGAFKYHLDRYKYPQRYGLTDGLESRGAGALYLEQLEQQLQSGGFLYGARAALADMAIAPFVRQYAHTDAVWFQAQPWPALQTWLQAFETSVLFEQVMHKQPLWRPGAAPTLLTWSATPPL